MIEASLLAPAPLASSRERVKGKRPACVGIPLTAPVATFSARPGGKGDAPVTENVKGAVPPVITGVPLYGKVTSPLGKLAESDEAGFTVMEKVCRSNSWVRALVAVSVTEYVAGDDKAGKAPEIVALRPEDCGNVTETPDGNVLDPSCQKLFWLARIVRVNETLVVTGASELVVVNPSCNKVVKTYDCCAWNTELTVADTTKE